ncbi:MAG: HEAT repeat domain-containing protein, partial [Planctomycetes bacterium]|nr:HEAT repeat domain-containing protein [Planctomycetota bacterium]
MNRSLLLLLILLTAVALPADGRAQDERKVSQKIAAAGEDAQREWFTELGSFKTDLAFNLLKARCDDLLQKSRKYNFAYRGFLPFRGQGKLEQKALKYLKKSALSGLNQQATAAVIVLSQWGPSSHPFLQEIVFKAEESRLRAYAIGPLLPGFCRSKDSKRLEILLQNYKIPASGSIEKFAASLEAVPQKQLLERMESWLQTRVPPALLEGAIQALQSIAGPEVQPILVKSLRSEDAGVVFAVLLELRRRGAQGYSKQLFPLLKSNDTTLRYFALIEKGRMMVGEPKWESFVEQLSESYDRVDRQASATIASHLPASQAWPYLVKLLADNERSVRIQALVTVGALRLPQAVPVLIQRMIAEQTAGNLVMRDRIVDVLADLTGQTFGPASHTWQLWWDNEKDRFVFPTAEEILAKAKEREAQLEENSTVGSFYGLPVVSNRAVFIVDLSGSMNSAAKTNRYTGEKKATRLDVAKAQLILALKN